MHYLFIEDFNVNFNPITSRVFGIFIKADLRMMMKPLFSNVAEFFCHFDRNSTKPIIFCICQIRHNKY